MKKGINKWIAFNFDSISNDQQIMKSKDLDTAHPTIEAKKTKNNELCSNKKIIDFNFFKKIEPKTIEDLAIHPKKIKEVESWLRENVNLSPKKISSTILLVTGPTGSGKTITINVLCKILKIKILEWINPIDENDFTSSQISKFMDFFSLGKYRSLLENSDTKQLLLIEDFPNFVTFNTSEFTSILEKCFNENTPAIFICTDVNNCSKLDLSQTLFSQEVKEKFRITHISFNPCSVTLLKGALTRASKLVREHLDLFQLPLSDVVDAIISSCMGDVRYAINQYYFACLKGAIKMPVIPNTKKQVGKRKRKEKQSSSITFMVKDETLQFFHSLGRVLNPKRIETGNGWRLQCDIQALINQFDSRPFNLNSFLHENYLKYFNDLGDIEKASCILSDSQRFLDKWTESHEITTYSLWLSILGLMIYNEHKASKWNQITAPTKIKQTIKNRAAMENLNKTDLLYYNIINSSKTLYTFK